ncbi:POU domain, class 4, transcription factor 1 [Galemys pyrenaicus]|uniref:POU domain, class 4, transcription factor 1 n=1 Tax=Galemys pyrenaicus TaxID=202257 RepID=A0A8J6AD60_GALPY|nr:POU domain, class 4, transcription factor 1 [Galemys pyrenaicus]
MRPTETADACQRRGAASSRESSPDRPREVGLRCKRSASRRRAGLERSEKWDREAGARRSERSKGAPGGSRSSINPRRGRRFRAASSRGSSLGREAGGAGVRTFSSDFRSVCGFTCQAIKMMSMNSKQPHFAMHPTLPEHKYPSLHSSSEAIRRACLPTPPVSAPRPRPRPARPPLRVSRALRVRCCRVHGSRCGDVWPGIVEEPRCEARSVQYSGA